MVITKVFRTMKKATQPYQLNQITMVSKLNLPTYGFSNTIENTASGP